MRIFDKHIAVMIRIYRKVYDFLNITPPYKVFLKILLETYTNIWENSTALIGMYKKEK